MLAGEFTRHLHIRQSEIETERAAATASAVAAVARLVLSPFLRR